MSTAHALTPTPSSTWRVPFHDAIVDEASIVRVVTVLRSGWLTTGPECRAFEREFAAMVGPDVEAVAVNSATAALHLALEAVGIGSGDLVLTTPYTFTATAEAICYLGADPVFVDVDPVTANLTVDTVSVALARLSARDRARIRAILPVHIAGLPCDLSSLTDLATAEEWRVVDDAAHALPARHAGHVIGGSPGVDATAFSFYATKPLSTGEGGMLVTSREDVAARARVMRLHGIDRDVFDRYSLRDRWYYEVTEVGHKYNMTDVAAALGRGQLLHVDRQRTRRAAIAARYSARFAQLPSIEVPVDAPIGDLHAWHLYTLRIGDGRAVRDAFIRQLADLGVGTSVHFIPLHLQPYYRDRYGLTAEDLPAATRFFEQEVSLPIFPSMTDEQVEVVLDAVPEALMRARDEVGT